MNEYLYSQNIRGDSAVILCDGVPMEIDDVVMRLNELDELVSYLHEELNSSTKFLDGDY